MQIKLGSWVAGRPDAPQGTIDWAGGLANFDNGPSRAYYRRISVTDYAGGIEGAKQYIYSDKSGTWESIVIKTDEGDFQSKGVNEDDDEDDESSSSVAPTTSAAVPSSTGEAEDSAGGDENDDEPDAASLAAQAVTYVGAILSGAAIFANIL